jgi:putative DNA primase/helicase
MKIQKPIRLAKFTKKSSRSRTTSVLLPPEFSEDGIAAIFTRESGGDFRYTAAWGRWHRWNGRFWEYDDTRLVLELVRQVCRVVSSECPDEKLRRRIASAYTVAAVERLIRSDRQHAAMIDQWDSDPWMLNTLGGTIDLSTGELRPSQREDYCTKVTAAAPGDACPVWMAFLSRVTDGNVELQCYLQRICGYLLTGSTRDQVWFFLYGTGANGKSVFINTIAGVMGDYARTAPIETFTETMFDQHPTDLAGLQGARLVSVMETEEGRAWAENKIKRLTGGDSISARFMRQDFFEYVPQFKLVVVGNHKPGLRSVDEATRRRLHLVPFTVTIPKAERDPELFEKLKAEWPGILHWMIEGCVAWQREGLNPPPVVSAATEDYLATEDLVARWIEECCVTGPNFSAPVADLYRSYQLWCAANGEAVCSQKRFSQNLEARKFTKVRSSISRKFSGIALRGQTVEGGQPA